MQFSIKLSCQSAATQAPRVGQTMLSGKAMSALSLVGNFRGDFLAVDTCRRGAGGVCVIHSFPNSYTPVLKTPARWPLIVNNDCSTDSIWAVGRSVFINIQSALCIHPPDTDADADVQHVSPVRKIPGITSVV